MRIMYFALQVFQNDCYNIGYIVTISKKTLEKCLFLVILPCIDEKVGFINGYTYRRRKNTNT